MKQIIFISNGIIKDVDDAGYIVCVTQGELKVKAQRLVDKGVARWIKDKVTFEDLKETASEIFRLTHELEEQMKNDSLSKTERGVL